jgi:hypothetical protein
LASEGEGLDDMSEENAGIREPSLEEGASPEFVGDPQEMWIEEYEREGRRVKPRKEREEPRRVLRWIVLAAVIVVLVMWTLISPSVMPATGTTYTTSYATANLGSEAFAQDVRIAASLISAGSTTWAICMSGDSNATADEDAVFQVMVVKISEDSGGFWFMGTDISLRNVSFYSEDDALIGWMTDKEEKSDRSIGEVHVTFSEVGVHDCHVTVKFSVYEVMRIGFLPADKMSITVSLTDSIVVSERAEIGPS